MIDNKELTRQNEALLARLAKSRTTLSRFKGNKNKPLLRV